MRRLVLAAALTTVGACSGYGYGRWATRPTETELVLGRTTPEEVVARFGNPEWTASLHREGTSLRTWTYAYTAVPSGIGDGPEPMRRMTVTLHRRVVVGYLFLSSYDGERTDFDESRVASIVKGETTRAQLESLLGRPAGRRLPPATAPAAVEEWMYAYAHSRNRAVFEKSLVAGFGADGTVCSVEFTSRGSR